MPTDRSYNGSSAQPPWSPCSDAHHRPARSPRKTLRVPRHPLRIADFSGPRGNAEHSNDFRPEVVSVKSQSEIVWELTGNSGVNAKAFILSRVIMTYDNTVRLSRVIMQHEWARNEYTSCLALHPVLAFKSRDNEHMIRPDLR